MVKINLEEMVKISKMLDYENRYNFEYAKKFFKEIFGEEFYKQVEPDFESVIDNRLKEERIVDGIEVRSNSLHLPKRLRVHVPGIFYFKFFQANNTYNHSIKITDKTGIHWNMKTDIYGSDKTNSLSNIYSRQVIWFGNDNEGMSIEGRYLEGKLNEIEFEKSRFDDCFFDSFSSNMKNRYEYCSSLKEFRRGDDSDHDFFATNSIIKIPKKGFLSLEDFGDFYYLKNVDGEPVVQKLMNPNSDFKIPLELGEIEVKVYEQLKNG